MRHPAPARRVVPLAVLASAVLATACGGGDGGDTVARWQTVTDTIGDTVVVRTVGAADSVAAIGLVEELRIGELDGADEYSFAGVGAILPAPGGGVYVWDETTTQLRQYDSAGTYVRDVGRKGGGPGEYEDLAGLGVLPGGGLVAADPRNQRVTVFDTAGASAGSWPLLTNFYTNDGLVVDTAGAVYVLDILDPYDGSDPLKPRRQGYVRIHPGGERRDTVVAPDLGYDAPRLTAVRRSAQGTSSTTSNVPFSAQAFWRMSPHGYFVSAIGDRYAVTLHRPEGPLRIERDAPPVPVQADERAAEEERTTAMMRNNLPDWRWNGPAIPDTKAPIRSLRADADGRLWVGRAMPGVRIPDEEIDVPANPGPRAIPPRRWREPLAYDVFAPDGRYLGFVAVPPRTTLRYMSGEHAWGVVTDEMDVPYVVRFRLLWPAEP